MSNSTNRLLMGLCTLSSTAAPHGAQAPQHTHTAQPQPEQQLRCQEGGAAVFCQHLRHTGHLPAQAEREGRQCPGAEGAAIGGAGQIERPGQRREEHQPRQQLPDHRSGGDAVPAGAVLHEAGQHAPVKDDAAQHGGREAAGGGLPILPQPAQPQPEHPERAQRLQHCAQEHHHAAVHPEDAQHSGLSIADRCRQCRDAGGDAPPPQRVRLRLTAAARLSVSGPLHVRSLLFVSARRKVPLVSVQGSARYQEFVLHA